VELQGSLDAFRSRHASLVAVSVDSLQRSQVLARRLHITFPLLADPDLVAVRGYGVEDAQNEIAWPAVFVVAKSGRIAWRSLSETYRIQDRPASATILRILEQLASE
jgi:peroxiredoxin